MICSADEGVVLDFPELGSRIVYTTDSPLFRLHMESLENGEAKGEIVPADFAPPKIIHEADRTLLLYNGKPIAGAGQMTVKVLLEPAGQELLGRIEIENGSGLRLRRVRFPCLAYQAVESIDRLLFASPWGDEFPWPVKTIKQYCAMNGLESIYPGLKLEAIKTGQDEVAYTYPSVLAMQYLTLYNKGRSVYLACYSTDDNTLTLNAQVAGSGLIFSVNHYPFLAQGSWRSPECGLAVLPGDWHGAADLYASHMRGRFKPPAPPAWMRHDFHGWVQVMMHFEHQKPLHYYRNLPGIFREAREKTGLNILHVCGWNGRGHDTFYPDYNPDPELGTPEELKLAIGEIKALGGRVILYTNGRLVDPDSDFYRTIGKDCLCADEAGQTYQERYFNSVGFGVACPSCTEYGVYLSEQIRKLCADFGADAVQVDQISCNQGLFCYDKHHPHSTPANNFLAPTDKMLQHIRKTHKSLNPDSFTWIEGCHERFGQYYDVSQGHGEGEPGWEILGPVPEQFKYTYPDYIVTGSCNTIQQLCHTFSQGKPFDFGIERLDDADFLALLRCLLGLRKSYPEYFLRGIFRDNIGLEVTGDVRAYRLDHPDGAGTLVNLWLPGGGLKQHVKASMRHPALELRFEPLYPGVMSVKKDGNWLELAWEGPVAVLRFEAGIIDSNNK